MILDFITGKYEHDGIYTIKGILILKAIISSCDSAKIFHQIRGKFSLFPSDLLSRNPNFCVGGFLGFSNKRKHLACILQFFK